MFTSTLKRRLKASRPSHRCIRPRRSIPLAVEWLEDRAVPTIHFGFAFGMGWLGDDAGQGIATDRLGNVYVSGTFHGTVDFDPG